MNCQKKTIEIPYTVIARKEMSEELLKLEQKAIEMAQQAYAKYSNFRVGVALQLSNGEVVSASNQENAAYPSGLCAERTALFYAGAKYPEAKILKLVLVAYSPKERVEVISPCGACRQVMLETSVRQNQPYEVYLCGEKNTIVIEDNRLMLPFGFDGSDL